MYNSFYTIQAGLNDKIYWYDGGYAHTTTIPPGVYSASGSTNIATAIGTAMSANTSAGATLTAAFNAINGLLTITSNYNFNLNFGTYTAGSAAKTLGFTNTNTSLATSATATYLPNLGGPTSVNIRIIEADITTWTNGIGNFGNILLPLNVSQGSLKYYCKQDFSQYIGFNKPAQTLTISVCDTSGNQLSLNGTEFEIAIRKIK